jgi:hypothetical protein
MELPTKVAARDFDAPTMLLAHDPGGGGDGAGPCRTRR